MEGLLIINNGNVAIPVRRSVWMTASVFLPSTPRFQGRGGRSGGIYFGRSDFGERSRKSGERREREKKNSSEVPAGVSKLWNQVKQKG